MPAITPVVAPRPALFLAETGITAWRVDDGAVVATHDVIADLVTTELLRLPVQLMAPASGVLRHVAAAGARLRPGRLAAAILGHESGEADVAALVAGWPRADPVFAPPSTDTLQTAAGTLRRLVMGGEHVDAMPALMIHGFGGDVFTWMFQQPALATTRAVHAIELPGHGGSTRDVGAGDLAHLQGAVLAYMDAAGLARAHVVGHSMGGMITLGLTLDAPDRVVSASLVCPAGIGPEVDEAFIDGFVNAEGVAALAPWLRSLFADPSVASDMFVQLADQNLAAPGLRPALRAIRRGLFADPAARDLSPRFHELRRPVQAIWGAADTLTPAANAARLNGVADVLMLERAGHLPHMERSDDVTAALESFMRRCET